jgi:hypothetical protein
MRARIVDNLLVSIEKEMPNEGHRTDPDFLELCRRIEGKEVELVFIGGDAFEKEDNNYWLPNSCWTRV